ncbi:MAG TPA: outer membrane protein [Bradyrhizobium sp.]|jgi:outer membrane immunogenic protein|nr:outer membrane protein [Bradyrhizobium sp.]
MKFLSVTVAVVALTAPALAADFGVRPYTAPAAIYNWTGFYIGGHVGGGISSSEVLNGIVTTSNDGIRALGGVQAGADYQSGSFVAGVEGQYSWLGGANNGIVFPGGFVYSNERRALGSVTGRAGFAWGPALLYAKGGYAYSDNQERLTFGGVPLAFAFDRNRRDGYTVGAGVEYMFAPNFSAKFEYQYYDFGRSAFIAPVAFGAFRVDEHTVKAGLNYRFNWGAPLVARY